ncbi:ribosome-associated toxin RatA of RatAB toxin-antitoxin module [Saccharothrix tamanrassetensis]|uniref:Ribosome-associated toxin RatA of RatAB toxin-antitoxin module n=1 Tax=Saccharothrix tamanrassetensis TaxID=1051531 RepID=A0A841CUS5_9PSEU|nr:SRPBCC family protein [Saccharothrix tamanrassetensis]MBB5959898.1 ribosome-associated toxin RatA of RatAB toxin-antitoxin module [Saccharothrix tamanrassetensis]
MADESTQSIVIDAEPSRIVAVIADFAAYPEWANGVKRTEVLETGSDGYPAQVKFNIDQGPIKDEYVLAYDEWSPQRISWRLVKGQMQKSQEGSYAFTARGGSTEVTYTLSVQLVVPMIGLFRRKAEKMIMDTALKELKRRVENAG